ncbi:MAG: sugar kinase [Gemmatales bacterium]|nr:sugar kinase [Gemmatales bacterium]
MTKAVITFGEAMLRLSPPAFHRLEQARSFEVKVGGAELNTAVALVRLGRRASWVSRLTDNPLGRLLACQVREAGVGTDYILWTNEDRIGLYFLEFGAAPRASSVLYDRKGSAIAAIRPGLVPWQAIFAEACWFHVTGITPALSLSAAEATEEALAAAAAAGVPISIDLNYRAKLWSTEEAYRWMHKFVQQAQVLITTEEDANKVLRIEGTDYAAVARRLAETYPNLHVVAITLRDNPFVWRNSWTAIAYAGGKIYQTRTYEVEIVDRLGAGDAFAAGLIHGLLDQDVQKGLDWGVAISAIKHSIPGDFAWVTASEVESLLRSPQLRISR